MSSVCTPILVGVPVPVSEILLLSKTAKFPFLTMDYSPWSSKNLIDRNRLTYFTLFLKYFHNHSLDFVSQWNSWRTKNELTSKALIFMHSNRFYKLNIYITCTCFFFSETGDINTLMSTGRDTFPSLISFIVCLSSCGLLILCPLPPKHSAILS